MLKELFAGATRFEDFLAGVTVNADLWRALSRRASVSDEHAGRARVRRRQWRLLVILEDWCGDAVNIVPVIAALVRQAPNLEMRVVRRDEHPELMDSHLTGTSRSIPVVILLDDQFNERAWWGPRPAQLQGWVAGEARALPKDVRYRETRRWYALDHGRSTVQELLDLMDLAEAA